MDGLLPVWKPVGMTSYDVIRIFKNEVLKKLSDKVKVGHAGTLDPFAEGVLILMLGKGTRQFGEIQSWPKTYRAVARLGEKSDTLDRTGKISEQHTANSKQLTVEQIQNAAVNFVGEIEQKIPDYSAAKINGQPRYKLARKGEAIQAKSKKVKIDSIKVINVQHFDNSNYRSEIELLIKCSSGTYIRQLSYDIFQTFRIESYLEKLMREAIGEIRKEECSQIDDMGNGAWVNYVQYNK